MNASNVLTQDGGFWQAGNTCPYTGSVTGSPTSAQFIDTAVSPATQNNYRGSTVAMTSGTQAAKNAVIALQRSDTFLLTLSTGLSGAPSVADTYKICTNITTIDGTHPTSFAHAQIATNFPTGLIQ